MAHTRITLATPAKHHLFEHLLQAMAASPESVSQLLTAQSPEGSAAGIGWEAGTPRSTFFYPGQGSSFWKLWRVELLLPPHPPLLPSPSQELNGSSRKSCHPEYEL